MDRRQAKREACWRAASALETAREQGWPSSMYDDEEVGAKVDAQMLVLIAELERRGGAE